jgi:hypothetical protein
MYYTSLFGGGLPGSDLTRATGLFPYSLTASNYTNLLVDPTIGAATFTVLKNGSPSLLAVSSSAGQTGYFIDGTDIVNFAVGDSCANQFVTRQGSVTWVNAALLLQADE